MHTISSAPPPKPALATFVAAFAHFCFAIFGFCQRLYFKAAASTPSRANDFDRLATTEEALATLEEALATTEETLATTEETLATTEEVLATLEETLAVRNLAQRIPNNK